LSGKMASQCKPFRQLKWNNTSPNRTLGTKIPVVQRSLETPMPIAELTWPTEFIDREKAHINDDDYGSLVIICRLKTHKETRLEVSGGKVMSKKSFQCIACACHCGYTYPYLCPYEYPCKYRAQGWCGSKNVDTVRLAILFGRLVVWLVRSGAATDETDLVGFGALQVPSATEEFASTGIQKVMCILILDHRVFGSTLKALDSEEPRDAISHVKRGARKLPLTPS
jgi:hypothetical protein